MRTKRKIISLLIVVILVMNLVACQSPPAKTVENPTTTPVTPPVTTEPVKVEPSAKDPGSIGLSLGTASLGGNFFTMGASMSAVIIDEVGYKTIAQATSGSSYNVGAVHNKEIDLGLTQATAIASALAGTDTFAGKPIDDITTIINYNATPIHILVNKKLGATNITDLEGATFECLAPGDGIEISTKKILPMLGVSIDKVKLEYSGNRVQASSRLKTKQVDVIFDATGKGATWISDIYGDGKDFDLLSLTEEQIKTLIENFPEYSRMTIPASTYTGQTAEVVTVGNWTTLIAHKDLDEEIVYNITKTLLENRESLIKAHSFFTDMVPENIIDSCIAPLHPGAERYYKEIGVIVK